MTPNTAGNIVCRICLHSVGDIPLSDAAACGLTFYEIFNQCTQLNANKFDDLPQFLCLRCASALQQSHGLIQQARDTDAELQQHLNTEHKPQAKLEPPEEFEAVAFQQLIFSTKDPLDESDDDDDETSRAYYFHSSPTAAGTGNDDFDEEDNKPLKYLLRNGGGEFQSMQSIAKSENPDEDTFYNVSVLELPDATSSVEDHIFPRGRYKCRTCDKAYFTTSGLDVHMEVHMPKDTTTKKKRLRAPTRKRNSTDAAKVSSKVALVVAEGAAPKPEPKQRKEKQPKPKKAFPCHECGKHMISASKLRYHMVMHTGEKNYLCTMCPKAYSTIYALKHHIRVHTGERPYECKFCGDRFLRPTTLKSHLRRHTGERPYGCNICGKRFIQHSSMTTHIKLNHKDKTIPCPHCDKKYARQTDLNTHLLSHTGDKPFACKLCPSRFIRQANLNKHMHSAHPLNCAAGDTTKSASARMAATKPEAEATSIYDMMPHQTVLM